MLRKILIVDDSEINRRILCNILRDNYSLLEAKNGQDALEILLSDPDGISAVLLDIVMPKMNGYELLSHIRNTPNIATIPVLVTTGTKESGSEAKALSLGANDYIEKPYNPDIIKHRLRNTINLRETAIVANAASKDDLTGLLNRRAFFEKAAEMIVDHEPGYYVLACFDINSFKIINDQYGTAKGDWVLRAIGDIFIKEFEAEGGICCRITADNFAVLYPSRLLDTDILGDIRNKISILDGSIHRITFSIGRYIVDDLSLPVSAMYDRAILAETSVKRRYDTNIAFYDESMRARLLHEQHIVNQMNNALDDKQFEVWLQPQYNHVTGAVVGAEALVRWRHPEQDLLIPPGEFIPIFERNGFIYEMDKYVWEQVCVLLRKWIDQGLSPLPISINISRYDLFCPDFFEVITSLIEKYSIPITLLQLEITETAFSKDAEQVIRVVKSLVSYGFIVEIDDFGSGYSSLNTLKDVPANILKLDMRFLGDDGATGRGGNILESIVRMAKWLNMTIIAEGVETIEQADYLKSIGCTFVQGFLYKKPIRIEEYETLIQCNPNENMTVSLETIETLDNSTFWSPNSIETLIFNSYIGGACVFEYYNDKLEFIRINDKFAHELGSERMTAQTIFDLDFSDFLDVHNMRLLYSTVRKAIKDKDEASCELCMSNFDYRYEHSYIYATFRVLANTGNRWLIYCTIINVSAQRQAELKQFEAASQIQLLTDTMPGGIAMYEYSGGSLHLLYFSDGFYKFTGYTREEYSEITRENPMALVCEEYIPLLQEQIEQLVNSNKQIDFTYRFLNKDGDLRWQVLKGSAGVRRLTSVIINAVVLDVTDQKVAEEQLRISEKEKQQTFNAIAAHSNRSVFYYDIPSKTAFVDTDEDECWFNDTILRYNDMPESIISKGLIFPESIDDYQRMFKEINEGKPTGEEKFHMYDPQGRARWIDMRYSLIYSDSNQPKTAVISFLDITNNHERELAYERYRQTILNDSDNRSIIIFDTDLTSDVVETIQGGLLDFNFPDCGCTHDEMVRAGIDALLTGDQHARAWAFFSREHLITSFADGLQHLSADWSTDFFAGQTHWVRAEILMTQDPYSGHTRAYTKLYDVTIEKVSELSVRRLAETDGITGLYNKTRTEALIRQILARGENTPCTLIIADLDNLKGINDTFGHPEGDKAISSIADILKAQFRHTDIIGRVGGDEFMVFIEGVSDESVLDKAMTSIIERCSQVRIGENPGIPLYASFGIATGQTGTSTFEELYKKADLALYYTKKHGKNQFAFFSEQSK